MYNCGCFEYDIEKRAFQNIDLRIIVPIAKQMGMTANLPLETN